MAGFYFFEIEIPTIIGNRSFCDIFYYHTHISSRVVVRCVDRTQYASIVIDFVFAKNKTWKMNQPYI